MRQKLYSFAVTLAVIFTATLGINLVTAQPAEAGRCILWLCGRLHHYDGAWNKRILVRCDFGVPSTNRYVPENRDDPCKDMDQVYVYRGAELWCRTWSGSTASWDYRKVFDATGWHKTNDLWDKSCAYRHD